MAQKPGIPSGTRDFGPGEIARRQYIIDTIRSVYHLYGYQPLETPVMENLSTLLGKYGDEGDKLVYRILNSGDWAKHIKSTYTNTEDIQAQKDSPLLAEKGLRYDLTVPFARYVVMHQNELTFPFKRYQIQPVWRADRPQKGRYREFYQCDADVIGSNSLLNDTELVLMIRDVFEKLQLNVTIRLNNRKILDGLAHYADCENLFSAMVVILDKADKIGTEGVQKELSELGLNEFQINRISEYLQCSGSNQDKLSYLSTILNNETGKKGHAELSELMDRLANYQSEHARVVIDLTLARGLSYYTGTIYEVVSNEVPMGSILGGGRYDDLTGIFGLPNMSGVGISFGLDRIYDILNVLNRYPASVQHHTDALFIPLDLNCENTAMKYANDFRRKNLCVEVYPDLDAKLAKKFKYADAKGIRYAILLGENENKSGLVTVKDLQTGQQQTLEATAAIEQLISERM